MKKTILSLALVAMGIAAYAQKPAAGDKTVEFNLNFQTGTAGVGYANGVNALGTQELRFRYFMADDMAIRLKVGLGSSTTKSSDMQSIGGADVTAERTEKTGFGFALTPGIEKHFAGTDKLSPFFGAELPIGILSGSTVEVSNGDNAAGTATGTGDAYKSETGSQFNIGLRLVLGADYYFTDAIYLGVEGGLGIFSMTSTGEGTTSMTTGNAGGAPVTVEGKSLKSSSSDLFGASAGTLRLGYKF
jgi:hypothetical protein